MRNACVTHVYATPITRRRSEFYRSMRSRELPFPTKRHVRQYLNSRDHFKHRPQCDRRERRMK